MKKEENKIELPPYSDKETEIQQQLLASLRERSNWEKEWSSNESSLFDIGAEGGILKGPYSGYTGTGVGEETDATQASDVIDNFVGINISDRNRQFIVSQLVGALPVVMTVPSSNEQGDIQAAVGGELVCQHFRQKHKLDSVLSRFYDMLSVYGTAFVKCVFDPDRGTVVEGPAGKCVALGDHKYSIPRIWDMFLDVNATCPEEMEYITERLWIPYATAAKFFPEDCLMYLDHYRVNDPTSSALTLGDNGALIQELKYDVIEVYERWETGSIANDWKGKLIYHTKDGRILLEKDSPCAFEYKSGRRQALDIARLPYIVKSYEYVVGQVYGRSPAAKVSRAQHFLNASMMVMISTAQSMSMPRLICDVDALGENKDTIFKNDSIDVIPLSLGGVQGGTMPFVLQGASTSNDLKEVISFNTTYINDAWGVTDSLLGKVSRETQGVMMQLSLVQGNAIRENLFQKTLLEAPKELYELSLQYAVKYWKVQRFVEVTGENNKIQAKKIKGSDIASGYAVYIERGTGFAMDPISRQDQMIRLLDVFRGAGVSDRYVLKQLKLGSLRGIYDKFDMAENRGQKILEQIKAGDKPMVFKHEDHMGIAIYMEEFEMTEEFTTLDPNVQKAIEAHIDLRYQAEAKKRVPEGPQAPQAPQAPADPMQALLGQLPPGPPKIGPM